MEPQMSIIEPPPPPPPPPKPTEEPKTGLFALLDGMPAHVLVVLGLLLALLAPTILYIKMANFRGASAEWNQARELVRLDVDQFKEDLNAKRQAEEDKATAEREKRNADNSLRSAQQRQRDLETQRTNLATAPISEEERQNETRRLRESIDQAQKDVDEAQKKIGESDERAKDAQTRLDDVKSRLGSVTESDLEKKERKAKEDNRLVEREKAYYDAQVSAAGSSFHLVLGWIGRLLLLVGLIVMTLQSQGLRQKILLIVLLVVMFSSLSGINLDLAAQGRLGEGPRETEVVPPPPPPSSTSPGRSPSTR